MSRLIDADALIERMRKYIDGDWHRNLGAVFTHGVEACINMAELAPTIEAVPVVHGEWIAKDEGYSDGYLDAIDEFAERCKGSVVCKLIGLRAIDIDFIAEEMKGENHE